MPPLHQQQARLQEQGCLRGGLLQHLPYPEAHRLLDQGAQAAGGWLGCCRYGRACCWSAPAQLTNPLTNPLTQSFTQSLTHSPTHLPSHSPSHPSLVLTRSLVQELQVYRTLEWDVNATADGDAELFCTLPLSDPVICDCEWP